MNTNTRRAMTAFSDFPPPADYPLHSAAEQVHAYAQPFTVLDRIRLRSSVENVRAGWVVNGEPFDHPSETVPVASAFRKPRYLADREAPSTFGLAGALRP